MVRPCDKPCGNKTASGYCATTACINPKYSNIGTAHYGQGVQKCIITNADRIRAMTDEELADALKGGCCREGEPYNCSEVGCKRCWLDWLRLECIK